MGEAHTKTATATAASEAISAPVAVERTNASLVVPPGDGDGDGEGGGGAGTGGGTKGAAPPDGPGKIGASITGDARDAAAGVASVLAAGHAFERYESITAVAFIIDHTERPNVETNSTSMPNWPAFEGYQRMCVANTLGNSPAAPTRRQYQLFGA